LDLMPMIIHRLSRLPSIPDRQRARWLRDVAKYALDHT